MTLVMPSAGTTTGVHGVNGMPSAFVTFIVTAELSSSARASNVPTVASSVVLMLMVTTVFLGVLALEHVERSTSDRRRVIEWSARRRSTGGASMVVLTQVPFEDADVTLHRPVLDAGIMGGDVGAAVASSGGGGTSAAVGGGDGSSAKLPVI